MEIRPILSALLRNKTGPILVAIQVALSLGIRQRPAHRAGAPGRVGPPFRAGTRGDVFALTVRHLKQGGHEDQLATQRKDTPRCAPCRACCRWPRPARCRCRAPVTTPAWRRTANRPSTAQASYYADSLIKTWGLQLVEGRDFLPNEVPEIDPTPATTSPSVIVTRALAEKMWPGQSSYVGKTVYFGTGDKARARKWSWSSACRRQARRSARRRVLDHARPPDRR
jgi:putative ABC transport system permease protein